MADLLRTFVTGSFGLLLRIFLIVVPIMVVLELFEGTRAFRAVVRAWARVVRHVGLNERSAAPTLIGFLFGLAYGGGVIVRDIRRHDLGRRQVFIMSTFLSMVHAIAEDSLDTPQLPDHPSYCGHRGDDSSAALRQDFRKCPKTGRRKGASGLSGSRLRLLAVRVARDPIGRPSPMSPAAAAG